ncbi:MAG: amino acid ABC transporter substrate-binding protein [Conexivisphaerales archaeon]
MTSRFFFKRAISTAAVAAIVVVLVIVVVAGVYIYTTSSKPKTSGPSVITIGMTMPLSGSLASDGQMSLDGLKMWAQDVNSSGGIPVSSLGKSLPVKLIYYDDGSNTQTVATDYAQLVTQGVNFLIAPYSSPLTLAAAPIAEAHHILLLSHGGASDSIWAKGYQYVVGVLSPGSQYMIPVIDMLNSLNPKPTNIAFFFGNDPFSLSVMKAVEPYALSKGFKIVFNQTYQESATDFTPQLSQIASTGAQVLIGGAHFVDGETIMRNLNSLGVKLDLVSLLVAPDDPHFLADLGPLANGVTVPSQWEPNLDFSKFSPYFGNIANGQQFYNRFMSLYGIAPNYEAAEAYATGLVLEKAIIDSGSLNSTIVRQQLSSENFYTFYGHFQIDSTGKQIGHTMVVAQWQNGTKQTIWPSSVATAQPLYPASSPSGPVSVMSQSSSSVFSQLSMNPVSIPYQQTASALVTTYQVPTGQSTKPS